MFKKFVTKSIGILLACGFIMLFINVNTSSIFSLPEKFYITNSELQEINKNKSLGEYVTAELSKDITVGQNQEKIGKLLIKLFGIIPIKEVDVNVVNGKVVYLGGIPLGFAINTKGVIIVGENSVSTSEGNSYTEKSKAVKSGDIIKYINDNPVNSAEDIKQVLESCEGENISLTLDRNGDKLVCDIIPLIDEQSEEYKLGLWVRNDASGIGTLTFVDKDNNKFGALGHPITDYETGIEVPVKNGKIYNCSLVGIKKGTKGDPGELRCLFMQGKNSKGDIEKNTPYGVYGVITNENGIIESNLLAEVSSRVNVKTGPAKIVSSVSGIREEYDIEIIKASYQPKSSDKSLIFRVKDKRLLTQTGGIIQGMSGSPILQDGKLIGAVTHVFVSDPTKGYGVYADWMLAQ